MIYEICRYNCALFNTPNCSESKNSLLNTRIVAVRDIWYKYGANTSVLWEYDMRLDISNPVDRLVTPLLNKHWNWRVGVAHIQCGTFSVFVSDFSEWPVGLLNSYHDILIEFVILGSMHESSDGTSVPLNGRLINTCMIRMIDVCGWCVWVMSLQYRA